MSTTVRNLYDLRHELMQCVAECEAQIKMLAGGVHGAVGLAELAALIRNQRKLEEVDGQLRRLAAVAG